MSESTKLNLRLPPETRDRLDGSASRNVFIDKAVNFYIDYLERADSASLLPSEVSSVIEGQLGQAVDRIGRLLFKQSVELSMMERIIAADRDYDFELLSELRAVCVRDVKRTNGQLAFRQMFDQEDDPWQS